MHEHAIYLTIYTSTLSTYNLTLRMINEFEGRKLERRLRDKFHNWYYRSRYLHARMPNSLMCVDASSFEILP